MRWGRNVRVCAGGAQSKTHLIVEQKRMIGHDPSQVALKTSFTAYEMSHEPHGFMAYATIPNNEMQKRAVRLYISSEEKPQRTS
jgi:hypothetical protein